jgi:hypothetical protein
METKEYIVALHEGVDYNQFWLDMENATSGLPHIPDRAVSITNNRPVFERICEYALTDDEADRVRNDSRVYSIDQPVENMPWITVGSFITQGDIFTKPTLNDSNNNFVNWGLPRHNSNVNVYANNSNPSYSYALDGTGVDVIISDSGIQEDHPEFTDSNGVSRVYNPGWDTIATQVNASGKTGWDAVSYVTGNNPIDGGHGTHVAGIVAGKTYGWSKNSRILSLKSAGSLPGSVADVFSMIKYWHQNKGSNRPTVVNMSWGFSINATYLGITNVSQISQVKQAISQITYRGTSYSSGGNNSDSFYQTKGLLLGSDSFAWTSLRNGLPVSSATYDTHINEMLDAGIILVRSAGNSSYKIDIPDGADYNNNFIFNLGAFLPGAGIYQFYYNRGSNPKVPITVGNIDSIQAGSTDQPAMSSMKGPGVSIWAAGSNIMSAWANNDGAGVAYFKNSAFKQKNLQGTSMASPQIAGMCALYLQKNPTATPAEVKNWLLTNATNTILNTGSYTDYTNPRSLLGSQPKVAYQNLQAELTTKSYIKDNTNTWREARAVYVKHTDNTWKQARLGWKKNDTGVWDKIYQL